ncbi:MAG TPA: dTMP kinase [Acholeplasma sp.]|jgi:dTMP kinase|nr:dTMP kinase [Acholeplasmatales bacterium]HHV33707.1 dTMP kinase [Acholeplasma sp.]
MFITFEGGEGSGKTSVIKAISSLLTEKNIDHVTTREPGGSIIAEKIRKVILDTENTNLSAEAEALLFAASRVQHLEEVILPALNENKIVLCDRYLDSSLAYQGYARGLGIEDVLKINHYAAKSLPDYTIYIDVTPELGLKRVSTRGAANRLDLETLEFHKKVREGYLKLAEMYKDRYIIIDGDCDLETLIERTLKKIKAVLA